MFGLQCGGTAKKTGPVFMVTLPIIVTRSIRVFASKKTKELVSTSFIARFEDGSEKIVNSKRWQPLGLLRTSDIGEMVMDKNTCTLYYRDKAAF